MLLCFNYLHWIGGCVWPLLSYASVVLAVVGVVLMQWIDCVSYVWGASGGCGVWGWDKEVFKPAYIGIDTTG
jgi:hypothetical protein